MIEAISNSQYNPHFKMMKKSQFKGLDLFCVERFKAPIDKFNKNEDLQKWADTKLQESLNKDYPGRDIDTFFKRSLMLREWGSFITNPINMAKSAALIIFTAITGALGKNDEKLPPVLNKEVLNSTLQELEKNSKKGQCNVNFQKKYQENLRKSILKEMGEGLKQGDCTWIEIKMEKDPSKFGKKVEKLKTLSAESWCTKDYRADIYLKDNDFHIMLQNGEPKVCIKVQNGIVSEVQGIKNDGIMPLKYLENIEDYIFQKNIEMDNYGITFDRASHSKLRFEQAQKGLKEDIENKDYKKIFEYFGIQTSQKGEKLILSEFKRPDYYFSYGDLGINEANLMKNVEEIKGDADFSMLKISTLPSLKKVGKNIRMINSSISSIPNLKYVGGDVYIAGSNINKEDFANVDVKGRVY